MKNLEKPINDLIQYRIEQAYSSIKTVEHLITFEDWNAAVSRIYYGMFYILLAVAAKEGFSTSKHQQLIGWFNREFIKSEKVPVKYGKMIGDTFKNRQISDYEAFTEFEKDEVIELFDDMKAFIEFINNYLTEQS